VVAVAVVVVVVIAEEEEQHKCPAMIAMKGSDYIWV